MSIVGKKVRWFSFKNTLLQNAFLAGIIIFLALKSGTIQAQNEFAVSCGAGKYELVNVGMQWNFTKKSSLSVHGGTNFGVDDKQLYSVGLTFDQVFLNPLFWNIKPGYSLGVVYWTQDDEWYYFETLTIPVNVLAEYSILPNLALRVKGGVVFSQNLVSDRKQNTTAGYPERFDENYQVSIIYKLNRHEK